MNPRLRFLALAAGLIVLGGCGEPAREPAPTPPEGFFGINGTVPRAWSSQGRHELVERHLRRIARSEIEFVRAHIDWQRLQPTPPVGERPAFDFAASDAWVGALARHGLRWYAVGLGSPTPAWTALPGLPPGCARGSPPARPGDLAAVMAAIAKRYGRGGQFWEERPELPRLPVVRYEVWNAPNHGGDWCPQPDAAAYARLYAATRSAVDAVDPAAEVIVGGLGAFRETRVGAGGAAEIEPGEFLADVIAADPSLEAAIDGVGVHIYAPTGAEALETLSWFATRLDQIGLGKVPISWNEIGWPTAGGDGETGAVTEEERASHLFEIAATDLTACGVESFAPHAWTTEERYPSDPEEWFGIADPETAEPYPSARALGEAIAAARRGRVRPGPCG